MAELPRILFDHEGGNLRYASLALIKWPQQGDEKKCEENYISSQIPRSDLDNKEVYFIVLLLEPKTGVLGFVTKGTA